MPTKLIEAPQAFFYFAQGFNQDATYFKSMDDLIRFCLGFVPRQQLSDFIAFAKRVERGEFTNMELDERWRRTESDYYLNGRAVRALMARARDIAEREGGDGSLYKKRVEMTRDPTLKLGF